MKMSEVKKTGEDVDKNPIYDSIEEDIEKLEQMICSCDTNFSSVTKETWREAVSPSSSISSIDSDEDFSSYISLGSNGGDNHSYKSKHMNYTNKYCDISSDDPLNESCVSLQEINMQIGVAEELVLTPNTRLKHGNKLLFGNLETIHEGKFLHTPPKSTENNPAAYDQQPSTNFLDRLERE